MKEGDHWGFLDTDVGKVKMKLKKYTVIKWIVFIWLRI
jgi:hypothetical protein